MTTICLRQQVQCLKNSVQPENSDGVEEDPGEVTPLVETLLCDEDDLEDPDWQIQREDVTISHVIEQMESNVTLSHSDRCQETQEVCLFWRERPRLSLIDQLLYRQVYNQHSQQYHQLVIPASHQERALEGSHNETGLMGYERTLELACVRLYWPKMSDSVERKCKTCERCLKRKACTQKNCEVVCIDYLSLERH